MNNFDEYIRQGEPGRSVKAATWQAAIGLQDVDGLKVTDRAFQRDKMTL